MPADEQKHTTMTPVPEFDPVAVADQIMAKATRGHPGPGHPHARPGFPPKLEGVEEAWGLNLKELTEVYRYMVVSELIAERQKRDVLFYDSRDSVRRNATAYDAGFAQREQTNAALYTAGGYRGGRGESKAQDNLFNIDEQSHLVAGMMKDYARVDMMRDAIASTMLELKSMVPVWMNEAVARWIIKLGVADEDRVKEVLLTIMKEDAPAKA